MTAFLFIPSAAGFGPGRRVNYADIANLFVERELPTAARAGRRSPIRIAMAILILVGILGDMVLVTRSETLASGHGSSRSVQPSVATARF